MTSINVDHGDINYHTSHLTIIIENQSYFVGIWDDNHRLLKAEVVEDDPASLLSNFGILDKAFKSKVIVSTDKAVHLPKSWSDNSMADQFIKGLPHAVRYSEKLLDQSACTHFMLSRDWHEKATADDTLRFCHISSIMANHQYPFTRDKVMVHFGTEGMYISISNREGLRFYNQYTCAGEKDYLFFIEAVLQECGLNPIDQKIYLSGKIMPDSSLYNLLSDYCGNMEFSESSLMKISATDSRPHHIYFDLFMARCA